ncbi:hypothetical protein CHU_1104 [Cytophaga hutchinsonii ATCC 33406]|uniref:Uncharacterized protein n=1 Tax=Cytophaga hutchinsonii (strain ATCC 33406 / DSM 1761 / CIP 103989 / NBRC 15051 / NCIMB 9469 / D465) TaxID=269798 RepID=A0A6N4SPY0_CYTH3|nr:hypothetical protein CHU_1104 [Cytophaga hutchinsonii ATCC 33406]
MDAYSMQRLGKKTGTSMVQVSRLYHTSRGELHSPCSNCIRPFLKAFVLFKQMRPVTVVLLT